MNRAQRIWLATILLAIGILLPFLAFQWRNSQPSAYDDRALYIFSPSSHDESSLSDEEIAQITRGCDIDQLSADELLQLYKGFERRMGEGEVALTGIRSAQQISDEGPAYGKQCQCYRKHAAGWTEIAMSTQFAPA